MAYVQLQDEGAADKPSGWLAPMTRLGRVTSILRRGNSKSEKAPLELRPQSSHWQPNTQEGALRQAAPQMAGAIDALHPAADSLGRPMQQDSLATQLSNW